MDPFDDDLLWANYGKADLATFEHPSGMAGPTCWTMIQRETVDGLLRLGTGQELYHKKWIRITCQKRKQGLLRQSYYKQNIVSIFGWRARIKQMGSFETYEAALQHSIAAMKDILKKLKTKNGGSPIFISIEFQCLQLPPTTPLTTPSLHPPRTFMQCHISNPINSYGNDTILYTISIP